LPIPLRPCSQILGDWRSRLRSAEPRICEDAGPETVGSRKSGSDRVWARIAWNQGSSTQRCTAGTLDGANEADRSDAIAAFAHQFPQVPLLITSQSAVGENWEVWRLPETIDDLRDALLTRWLGKEKGALLSHRLQAADAADLSETIVSGYDVRLIADLAEADPALTTLPANRTALYRTMLARASGVDGQPIQLESLRQLAWTMLKERRRKFTAADITSLGAGNLNALMHDKVRIVRSVDGTQEFRHDQMRAFLAALYLLEDTPGVSAMTQTMLDDKAFALSTRDQEELGHFLASLLTDTDLKVLWRFANEDPEARGRLLKALQTEADKQNLTLVREARRRRRPGNKDAA
jgi:hypothetical protein